MIRIMRQLVEQLRIIHDEAVDYGFELVGGLLLMLVIDANDIGTRFLCRARRCRDILEDGTAFGRNCLVDELPRD